MHHPFHVHGAGRFIILSRDGGPETNFVWKDTVLLRAGETIDILLYLTNPGLWMAHCHIVGLLTRLPGILDAGQWNIVATRPNPDHTRLLLARTE